MKCILKGKFGKLPASANKSNRKINNKPCYLIKSDCNSVKTYVYSSLVESVLKVDNNALFEFKL